MWFYLGLLGIAVALAESLLIALHHRARLCHKLALVKGHTVDVRNPLAKLRLKPSCQAYLLLSRSLHEARDLHTRFAWRI